MSYPGFIKKLSWVGGGNMIQYYFNSKKNNLFKKSNLNFEIIQKSMKNTVIFNDFENIYDFSIVRNEIYYNWRFFDNPVDKYTLFFIKDNKKIVGIFVLKKYLCDSTIVGHIVDWNILNPKYFIDIINFTKNYFFKKNIKKFSLWSLEKQKKILNINKICESEVIMDRTYFGYRLLDEKFSNNININNFKICMGDIDVF